MGSWAMSWSRGRGHGARVEGMGAMEGHGAMSHGCQEVEGTGAMGGGSHAERAEGVGRAGRAERAGMHWGPFHLIGSRGMGPRGHGKCAWGGGGVRAGRAGRAGMHWGHLRQGNGERGKCETCIHEVWVVGAMWDHGAMSHGCQGVEGMGAMRWTWEGGESGEGGAGGHAPGSDRSMGPRTWEGCMGGGGG